MNPAQENDTPTPLPSGKMRAWKWIQILLVIAALAFASIAVSRQWTELKETASQLEPNWLTLVAASLIVLATYAVLVQSWRWLVSGFGSRLGYFTAVRVWTVSNLGRYIPGTLWSIVGMGILAQQEGVQPSAAAGSALIGTLLNLGAGFGVVALSGSAVLHEVSPGLRIGAIVGATFFIGVVIGAPWLLPRITTLLSHRFSKILPDQHLPPTTLWGAVTLNVISWFGYGAAMMVFSHAFYPSMAGSFAQWVGIWAAAYIAGYMIFLVPAGFGVREGVLILLLTALHLCTKSEATLISVASRLWFTMLELIPGLIGLAVSPLARKAIAKSKR